MGNAGGTVCGLISLRQRYSGIILAMEAKEAPVDLERDPDEPDRQTAPGWTTCERYYSREQGR